jgi:Protein of unknown function (DUF1822)
MSYTEYLDGFLDDYFGSVPTETIDLDAEQVEQAIEFSNTATHRQRQVYLQCLARFGFAEWLKKRQPSLFTQDLMLLEPANRHIIDVVFNLHINNFRLCLIPTILFSDDEITVPRAVIDLPEFAHHFYVIIAIDEELNVIGIKGFMRYDELSNYRAQLQPQIDWTYQLSLSNFSQDPNELLLYLQHLAPDAIALPEVTSRKNTLVSIQQELLQILPQVGNRSLWQVLNWRQSETVLTTPEILKWLDTEDTPHKSTHLSDLLQILTQQVIDARDWLSNQFDWQVRPLASAFRGEIRELTEIITKISQQNNIEIPKTASYAFQDIFNTSVRIHVITWALNSDEWALLLILTSTNYPLALEYNLRVSDQNAILASETLLPNNQDQCVYALVVGNHQDIFVATITSAQGETHVLPPFKLS